MDFTYEQIAKMIDHSLLNPVLTDEELDRGCQVALDYDVASVCIKPYYLKRCSELLAGSTVAPSTVVGFPHGGHTTAVKLAEAERALADGGRELDMVVNVGKVLSGQWDYVREDVRAVVAKNTLDVPAGETGEVDTVEFQRRYIITVAHEVAQFQPDGYHYGFILT